MPSNDLHDRRPRSGAAGFTLVELLVVVAIVVILAGILLPVVNTVRKRAYTADTQNLLTQIQSAINAYQQEFRAFPGPLHNDQINRALTGAPPPTDPSDDPVLSDGRTAKITMSENLVLALVGGLRRDGTGQVGYDASFTESGKGAQGLNRAQVKQYQAYLPPENLTPPNEQGLLPGRFADGSGVADDTIIPEFVDRYPNPLPILYLRARKGAPGVVTFGLWGTGAAQYDIAHIAAYTGAYTDTSNANSSSPSGSTPASPEWAAPGSDALSIGLGKGLEEYVTGDPTAPVDADTMGPLPYHGLRSVTNAAVLSANNASGTNPYYYPLDAAPYFANPSIANTPRAKDGFILISAGEDRVYGTDDDVTSFGSVQP